MTSLNTLIPYRIGGEEMTATEVWEWVDTCRSDPPANRVSLFFPDMPFEKGMELLQCFKGEEPETVKKLNVKIEGLEAENEKLEKMSEEFEDKQDAADLLKKLYDADLEGLLKMAAEIDPLKWRHLYFDVKHGRKDLVETLNLI